MSHDDRASDFEVNRFQERKQKLNKYLDKVKQKKIKHPKEGAAMDLLYHLLNSVVDQLELAQSYYSYGNGEITINTDLENCDRLVKNVFITLKEVKKIVLRFLFVDLSSCRFIVREYNQIELIMWWESVREDKVFNYFSESRKVEEDECEYQIDDFDEYEVVNNDLSTRFSINDRDFFCDTKTIDASKKRVAKEVKMELSKRNRVFSKDIKKLKKISGIVKQDDWKKLDRLNYKIPQKYIQWKELIDVFKVSIEDGVITIAKKDWNQHEIGQVALATMKWVETSSPLFLVTNELIEVFKELNPPTVEQLLTATESLCSSVVLVFPLQCQYLSSDSMGRFDYCVITKDTGYYSAERNNLAELKRVEDSIVACGGITTEMVSFHYCFADYLYLGVEDMNSHSVEAVFLRIVAQCLLLIASKPELVITSDQIKSFNYETSGQGFQKPKNGEKVLYPRVLNLSYAEKKIRSDDNRIQRQGNYSPKSPHWRLGYEVNKPVGKMKGVPKEQWERKKIKVAPYFVLGGDDKDDSTKGLSPVGSEFKKTIDNNQEF
jgi:hypothetical protein